MHHRRNRHSLHRAHRNHNPSMSGRRRNGVEDYISHMEFEGDDFSGDMLVVYLRPGAPSSVEGLVESILDVAAEAVSDDLRINAGKLHGKCVRQYPKKLIYPMINFFNVDDFSHLSDPAIGEAVITWQEAFLSQLKALGIPSNWGWYLDEGVESYDDSEDEDDDDDDSGRTENPKSKLPPSELPPSEILKNIQRQQREIEKLLFPDGLMGKPTPSYEVEIRKGRQVAQVIKYKTLREAKARFAHALERFRSKDIPNELKDKRYDGFSMHLIVNGEEVDSFTYHFK